MRFKFRTLLCIPLLVALVANTALAQRGALIEDLFRTVAEVQLQREQQKQAERERQLQRPPTPPSAQIQPIPVPANRNRQTGGPRSINTSNREVAVLAQSLIEFSGVSQALVQDLRQSAARNSAIAPLMPEAYQIDADIWTLIQRCDGMTSIGPLIEPYSSLDARWRQLSYRLRAFDGLDSRCTAGVRACDKFVSTIARHLNIEPQFDRHGLHDLMLIAATHMESLLDDLELADIDHRDAKRLTHDLRLLRQHLMAESDRVTYVNYDEAVTAFSDFNSRWSRFSAQIYAINDPHLQRRLDRIRLCGDQTYELLWIPAPYNAGTLTVAAQRLEAECGKMLDQLTIRSMVSLTASDQVRLLESSRRMYRASQELSELTIGSATRGELQQRFSAIDSDWTFVQATCRKLPLISGAPLVAIENQCQQLRRALGTSRTDGPTIEHAELLQLAASLEGAAEYFEADLMRFARYLTPAQFRTSIFDATHEFYHHAKDLHSALDQRESLGNLQQEAELMLDGWQQLTNHLNEIENHGLNGRRADGLRRAHQNLAPIVAQIAAALIQR